MPAAAKKIIYEIWAVFIAEAMNGRYVPKQVEFGTAIQTQNCLSLGVVNTSTCTWGSPVAFKRTTRLYAPGLGECQVLREDKYFMDPIAGEVYRVSKPGKSLIKVAAQAIISKKTNTTEPYLKRYRVSLFAPFLVVQNNTH
jgi:hypothetical protein